MNAAIQTARLDAGQLGADTVPIAGGERAHVGDVVVTRRNARDLTTSGERVRNRERWTVTDSTPTVPHRDPVQGHGRSPCPPTTWSSTSGWGMRRPSTAARATPSTSASTSPPTPPPAATSTSAPPADGTANHLHITTTSTDPSEARDVLERILTTDRADLPATTIRRTLAAAEDRHRRVPIPAWMDDVRHELLERKTVAAEREAAAVARLADLERRVEDA